MSEPQFIPARPDELPLGPGVRILEANEDGLVALDKPTGLMSHPNRHEDRERSLLGAHYDYEQERYEWTTEGGEARCAWLINRLDSPTSGVILLALDPDLNAEIKQQFSTHRVRKVYYALVKRSPVKPAGIWSDTLHKTIERNGRLIKGARLVSAKTRYQIMKEPRGGFPICLIKLMPITGRTHQLRVQCKRNQHPIVGDKTYGSFSFNREVEMETGEDRLMLHSAETVVNYAFRGRSRSFSATSALPEPFHKVLAFRPGLRTGRPNPAGPRGPLAGRRFRRP